MGVKPRRVGIPLTDGLCNLEGEGWRCWEMEGLKGLEEEKAEGGINQRQGMREKR